MKIYTREGDKGKTSLFSGERVLKNHPQVETYGDLDELNSAIGMITAAIGKTGSGASHRLIDIQTHLMAAGAWLAATPGSSSAQSLPPFPTDSTTELEKIIDRLETDLFPLKHFILPGGHPSAAAAHLARTICRRAERRMVEVMMELPEDSPPSYENILIYLNRLSDYLFVLARHCNHIHGFEDILWAP